MLASSEPESSRPEGDPRFATDQTHLMRRSGDRRANDGPRTRDFLDGTVGVLPLNYARADGRTGHAHQLQGRTGSRTLPHGVAIRVIPRTYGHKAPGVGVEPTPP